METSFLVKSSVDFVYDPFGMITYGREWHTGSDYRYGFNGQEQDDEVMGDGTVYDYGARVYNARLCKFFSVDPLAYNFAWNSPYSFAENDVIRAIDLDGLEKFVVSVLSYADDGTEILLVTVEDVEAPFQVYDARDGITRDYFRAANIQRNLGDAYYDADAGKLMTPSLEGASNGKTWFYNPNGQGPGMDKTPMFSATFPNEGETPTHIENKEVHHTSNATIENMNTPDDPAPDAVNTYNVPVPPSTTTTTLSLSYSDYAGVGNSFTLVDVATGIPLVPINPLTGASMPTTFSGEGFADYDVTGITSLQIIVTSTEPGYVGDQYSANFLFDYTKTEPVVTPDIKPRE